jgi:hypothetical protein
MDFIVDWLAPIGSGLISFLAVATAALLLPFNFPFRVVFFLLWVRLHLFAESRYGSTAK